MSSRNYLPLFHKGSIMFGTIGSRPSHVDGESFFFSGFMFRPSHFFFVCLPPCLEHYFGTNTSGSQMTHVRLNNQNRLHSSIRVYTVRPTPTAMGG